MKDVKIKGRECIHARYSRSKSNDNDDILLVKENVHYEDGTVKPNIRVIKNFEREFYVTKPGFRNHKQKKEWEEKSKCNKYVCTQANLPTALAKALGKPLGTNLRYLNNSPYVYGTDITTEKIVKNLYKQKWPDCISKWSLAVMDYETDMVYGTEKIISGSITYRDRVTLCFTKSFLNGSKKTIDRIHEEFENYLGKYKKERNINLEVICVDTDIQVVHVLTRRAHEWIPDIVGFWNISFDMEKMIDSIRSHKMYAEDFFSYPKLENRFKTFTWKKKNPKKETLSGKKKTVFNEELWHKAIHPAGFYMIDLMSLYCNIRMASGKRESYSLDSVLKDELNIEKLKFKAADHIPSGDPKWHTFMQQNYKVEYLIYNIFDCISVELLDEKNNDVAQTLPVLLGSSDVNTFDSNPRKLSDSLHFFCEKEKMVMGSTAEDMTEVTDKLQADKSGWIVTLASHLIEKDIGLNHISEDKNLTSNIHAMVSDLDIEGSYPTSEIILNISKETTRREMCKIEGLDEFTKRNIGLNLTNARGNAVEIACNALSLPSFDQLLEMVD